MDFSYRTLSYLDCNTIKARERKYLMDGCQSVFAELILFCIYCSGSILFPCWSWANLIILPRKISDKHSVQSTSSRKMRGREQHVFTLFSYENMMQTSKRNEMKCFGMGDTSCEQWSTQQSTIRALGQTKKFKMSFFAPFSNFHNFLKQLTYSRIRKF